MSRRLPAWRGDRWIERGPRRWWYGLVRCGREGSLWIPTDDRGDRVEDTEQERVVLALLHGLRGVRNVWAGSWNLSPPALRALDRWVRSRCRLQEREARATNAAGARALLRSRPRWARSERQVWTVARLAGLSGRGEEGKLELVSTRVPGVWRARCWAIGQDGLADRAAWLRERLGNLAHPGSISRGAIAPRVRWFQLGLAGRSRLLRLLLARRRGVVKELAVVWSA